MKEQHVYHLGRNWVTSPSRVIKDLNLGPDFSNANKANLQYKTEIGTAAHACIELLNKGVLDEQTIDPAVIPYVHAYRKFVSASGFSLAGCEIGIYSNLHNFAMKVDLVGEVNGSLSLIDIKTSTSIHPCVELQVGAYELGYNEVNKSRPISKRFYLHLKQNGDFRLGECDTSPFLFLDALKLWEWKRKKGEIKCPINL